MKFLCVLFLVFNYIKICNLIVYKVKNIVCNMIHNKNIIKIFDFFLPTRQYLSLLSFFARTWNFCQFFPSRRGRYSFAELFDQCLFLHAFFENVCLYMHFCLSAHDYWVEWKQRYVVGIYNLYSDIAERSEGCVL